jgi:hypothetical protein
MARLQGHIPLDKTHTLPIEEQGRVEVGSQDCAVISTLQVEYAKSRFATLTRGSTEREQVYIADLPGPDGMERVC